MLGHRGLAPQRNRQERACYSRRGSPRKIVCSPLYPARIVGICWHAASTSTCALPIRPGEHIRHFFFPTDSCISLITPNDGRIGIALFMGGETTPSRAIVQSAGHAYRLIGQQLKDEFHRNGEMQLLLLRYTPALITQMSQTAVCHRHHSVDQQLCRWLLLSLDRLSSNQLTMTQELIANMLGVRREGVTEAAGKLHKLGVIRYARGQITVLDRLRLEQLCCECYAVVRKESDRLNLLPLPALAPFLAGPLIATS